MRVDLLRVGKVAPCEGIETDKLQQPMGNDSVRKVARFEGIELSEPLINQAGNHVRRLPRFEGIVTHSLHRRSLWTTSEGCPL